VAAAFDQCIDRVAPMWRRLPDSVLTARYQFANSPAGLPPFRYRQDGLGLIMLEGHQRFPAGISLIRPQPCTRSKQAPQCHIHLSTKISTDRPIMRINFCQSLTLGDSDTSRNISVR